MSQTVRVTAESPTPLYFAWKRAMNQTYSEGEPFWYVKYKGQIEYKCETVKVLKKHGYTHSVELEFPSESDMSWFLLRWAP